MIIPNKHDGWVKNVRRVYDGGGSSTPSTTTQTTDLPDWAKPYAQEALEKGKQLSNQPYQRYDQPRFAGFSPMQLQAQEGVAGMNIPGQMSDASAITRNAAMRGLGASYQPGYFGNQFQAPNPYETGDFDYSNVNAPNLMQYQMGPAERVYGGDYDAPMMDTAQTGYRPDIQAFQMGPADQVRAGQYNTPEMQAAQTGYRPDLQQYQMGPAERVAGGQYGAYTMDAAQTGYRPDLQQYQMGPAQQVGTQDYTGGNVAKYMDPYMQQVVGVQQREAQRQSDIAGTQEAGQAVKQGAFGGSRAGLLEAERQRNLATQLGNIQATGSQAAFQNAQQQFNTQQQRELAAQQANQAAGLTAGGQNLAAQLGVQQLGTQTGLQTALANLNNQQQAAAQNQAAQMQAQGLSANQAMQAALANQQAGLTTGGQNLAAQLGVQQLGTQAGLQTAFANLNNQQQAAVQNQAAQLQTQGLSAGQAMQAALANQQAGLTVGQQNLASQQQAQQLGTQTGLQTALANLSAQNQANVQNQAAKLQAQGLTANQAMQAALANQQAGLTTGQQNLAAQLGIQQLGAGQNMQAQLANQQAYQNMLQQREASRQFGYGQDMTAAQLRAQYGQAAQQLGEQSRQFGAGYGMQGLGTALQGAGQLGNLGQQEFGQQRDIYNLQNQFGREQQALRQQGLSQAYQDFLDERNNPYKQLGYMSDLIRGLPLGQQSTSQIYQAPGSMMGQLGGIGMGAYGLSRMMGAEGGEVREYADGGSVDSPENVTDIVDSLSDEQLPQAKQAAQARGDYEQLQAIMAEESRRASAEQAMQASERGGLAGAFNSMPQSTQQRMMAGGGIVAFAGGGVSPEFGGDAVEGTSVNPFDLARRVRGGKSIEEYYGEPAFKASAASAPASDRSFDKVEEKRLSQPRTSAPTASAKAKPAAKPASMNASISNAVAQMSKESGVPEESLRSIYDGYKKSLRDESAADMKDLLAMVNKSTGGSKEIKEQALGKALAEFGFKWAASAAQPGAKFLGSAATAAPTIAASQAESAKLAREMDQNDMKLRMNLKQFEIAQRKGDLATAASLAAQERQLMQQGKQLELQRSQLAETARSNRAREGIAAQRATAGGGAMQKAYLAGMSKAQDRAARIAKDNWGNIAVQQDLKKQGFQSFDQYYDSLVKKEMKRAVPIYGVTAEAEADED